PGEERGVRALLPRAVSGAGDGRGGRAARGREGRDRGSGGAPVGRSAACGGVPIHYRARNAAAAFGDAARRVDRPRPRARGARHARPAPGAGARAAAGTDPFLDFWTGWAALTVVLEAW